MFNNFLSKAVTEQVKQTNMMNDADAEWNTTNYTEVRKKKKEMSYSMSSTWKKCA